MALAALVCSALVGGALAGSKDKAPAAGTPNGTAATQPATSGSMPSERRPMKSAPNGTAMGASQAMTQPATAMHGAKIQVYSSAQEGWS
jgi:hypothetical protein